MKLGRRGFLSAVGVALATLAMPHDGARWLQCNDKSVLEEKVAEQSTKFDGLWEIVNEYNTLRNELYKENVASEDKEKIWDKIEQYSVENFPEVFEGSFDQLKFQDLCRKNGKVYADLPNFKNPTHNILNLGSIREDYPEEVSFRKNRLNYNIVLFEKEGTNVYDILDIRGMGAFWDERTKTVYINLTAMKEDAKFIYEAGQQIKSNNPESFKSAMIKELYSSVMKEIKKENPSESELHSAFERKFVEVITKSTINHEVMHHFFRYNGNAEEKIMKEKGTFLYQIAEDPIFNSWAFLIAHDDGRYRDLYVTFENYRYIERKGYTKERLKKMKPEERAMIAKEILSKS